MAGHWFCSGGRDRRVLRCGGIPVFFTFDETFSLGILSAFAGAELETRGRTEERLSTGIVKEARELLISFLRAKDFFWAPGEGRRVSYRDFEDVKVRALVEAAFPRVLYWMRTGRAVPHNARVSLDFWRGGFCALDEFQEYLVRIGALASALGEALSFETLDGMTSEERAFGSTLFYALGTVTRKMQRV